MGKDGSGLNLGVTNQTFTFAGKITAGLNGVVGAAVADRELQYLHKTGSGKLTLTSSASDFRTSVSLQSGTISISNWAMRGTPSALGVGFSTASQTNDVVLGTGSNTAGTLQYTGPTVVTDRRLQTTNAAANTIEVTDPSASLTVGVFSGTGALHKSGSGTLVLGANATYTGATRVNTGTLQANGTFATSAVYVAQNATLNLSNASILRTLPVTLEAGATVNRLIAAGADFDGVFSNAAAGVGGLLGSHATLLDGVNAAGGATTVEMSWQPRGASDLFSDVLDLTGTRSDAFVLSLSYDGAQTENGLGLAWLSNGQWVNAVTGNTGGAVAFFEGAFADTGSPGLADDLGRWGVDTATDTVWAVLNHNSEFVVAALDHTTPPGLLLGDFDRSGARTNTDI
jgi:autotransporter-associated beta strand protein